MSSARYAHPAAASIPHQQPAYRGPAPVSNGPPGTFAPGTKVVVGNHRVTIEKYLSEGGFAHVYMVRVPKSPEHPTTPEIAVLKRVAVPDKDALANMRTEVETMKKLKGHKHIVTYMDSHASQLKGGGYEVFLLMEFCSGGGLIDFMNTRLQNRLKEPEILHIFSDVAEGVATMHYLKPPLLHRDLKVENVLITNSGPSKTYKLCDFGSTAPPRPAPTTAAEARLIEEDVQRHTTLQYRSPEMIDVYRKQPIDEKSDIWALGVLLYKLCYYTTPFEEVGQMAILNATFKYPPYPVFSDRLKRLIASMLRENPQQRPNIYQVVAEVCSMRHRNVPIKDIYSDRTQSEDRRNQQMPSTDPISSPPPVIGLQKVAPVQQVQHIPDVTPMRRGRPTAPVPPAPGARPSPSPMRGTASDPFAALDSQNDQVRRAAADELAARFPSLDEFSLLHDRGQKFQFGQAPAESKPEVINQRVTQALADDAFAFPSPKMESAPSPKPSPVVPPKDLSRSSPAPRPQTAQDRVRPSPLGIYQPSPQRPHVMVSSSTQTSPAPSPGLADLNKRLVWRVPDAPNHNRAMSTPRTFDKPLPNLKPDHTLPSRPSILDSRSKSHTSMLTIPKSPASSRPSLESSRPSAYDLGSALDRSKSANSQPRPSSIHVESNLDYLRDRERSFGGRLHSPSLSSRSPLGFPDSGIDSPDLEQEKNITSNVDFLRAMERNSINLSEDELSKHRRSSSQSRSKHAKRSSVSSITGTTKNIIKGRFGDAFRKFESNTANQPSPLSPRPDEYADRDPVSAVAGGVSSGKPLTPIAGSTVTGNSGSDDDRAQAIDETTDLPPEVRRELERRRLSQEEKRVADAAKEYRRQLAEQGDAPKGGKLATPNRASTIQNRVRSLLDDSQKGSPEKPRTAEGYGKYTDASAPAGLGLGNLEGGGKALPPRPMSQSQDKPPIARKPIPSLPPKQGQTAELSYGKTRPAGPPLTSSSAPPAALRTSTGPQARPSAPPKPKALRTGGPGDILPGAGSVKRRPGTAGSNLTGMGGGDGESEFDVDSFSKRYPSLSGLEMVETEIPPGRARGGVRDV